jgi:hypothetical protein
MDVKIKIMKKIGPREIRRRILLKLYEGFMTRREHTVTMEELVEELGIPELVVEASLLYMDAKGWVMSLFPSKLKISPAGIEMVEDKEQIVREFGSFSHVVLVVDGGIEGEIRFEDLYEKVASSSLSDTGKEEVVGYLKKIEQHVEEMGPSLEGIGEGLSHIMDKAEWLQPGLTSVICRVILARCGI